MLEIFKMQLAQILGGKMKWLVVICLSLPVLLTFTARTVGGLGQIRREVGRESEQRTFIQTGRLPETAEMERILWDGADKSFGPIHLTEDGIFSNEMFWYPRSEIRRRKKAGRSVTKLSALTKVKRGWIGGGKYILRDGELWRDKSRSKSRHWNIELTSKAVVPDTEVKADFSIESVAAIYHFLLYVQAISILLALFYGTSVLGHELDGKTLTYLFTRPIPRWHFVVGKYLGIVVALLPTTLISLTLSWLIFGGDGGIRLLASLLIGAAGAVLAYNALFILFGFLIPRRALVVALLYSIVFEFILSFVPALINQFTITYYLRSIVVNIVDIDIPQEATRIVGGASMTTSLLFLGGLIICTLATASYLARRREYVIQDAT